MADIVGFIEAVAALATAAGGLIGVLAARFHLNPKIQAIAADLEQAQAQVASHESTIKAAVQAVNVLAPQVDAALKQTQIDTLTKQINDATAQLNAVKATLPTK